MRLHRNLISIIYLIAHVVVAASSYVLTAVIEPIYTVLRADYGNAWRFAMNFCLNAFRTIRDLKPVYRESYDTNGLSLSGLALRT